MAYYEHNFKNVLYRMRSNYALSSPNNETKEYYHDKIMEFIVNYPDIVEKLITSINVNDNEDQSYDVKCRVATSILLESVLKNRIHKIGLLIYNLDNIMADSICSFLVQRNNLKQQLALLPYL